MFLRGYYHPQNSVTTGIRKAVHCSNGSWRSHCLAEAAVLRLEEITPSHAGIQRAQPALTAASLPSTLKFPSHRSLRVTPCFVLVMQPGPPPSAGGVTHAYLRWVSSL
eukprot:356193-Chlamydomonas_euryale.AAC.4